MNRASPSPDSSNLPLIIITVRFSVIVSKRDSWKIGRDRNEDEYRADLFSDDRLSLHHYLFANVTLPSLAAQLPVLTQDRFRLYAVTSSELPQKHASALDELMSKYPWARIKKVPPETQHVPHGECIEEFLGEVGYGQGAYAHVRLDDDDALAADLVKRIADLTTLENVGRAVSFASGYGGWFDSGRKAFTSFVQCRLPMIGLGLSYIGAYKDRAPVGRAANVYGLGRHTSVDTKVPVILDSRSPAFLRTFHEESDIQADSRTKFPAGEAAELSELPKHFPSLRNLIVPARHP